MRSDIENAVTMKQGKNHVNFHVQDLDDDDAYDEAKFDKTYDAIDANGDGLTNEVVLGSELNPVVLRKIKFDEVSIKMNDLFKLRLEIMKDIPASLELLCIFHSLFNPIQSNPMRQDERGFIESCICNDYLLS